MTNAPDSEPEKLKSIFLTQAGSIFAALAVSFILVRIFAALGLPPGATIMAHLVLFCTILYADPVSALKKGKSLRDVMVKLLVGCGFGLVLTLPFAMGFTPGDLSVEKTAAGPDEGGSGGLLKFGVLLVAILILPLFSLGPLAEKLLKQQNADQKITAEDMKISAAFPAFMAVSMALYLAVPGAMWLLDMPVMVAGLVMAAAILICVTDTWMASPDDLMSDPDNPDWGPRAASAHEAWAGFRKAVRHSFGSALFLGSVVYIALQLAIPFMGEASLNDTSPFPLIRELLVVSAVMLFGTLILFALGVFALAAAALLLGHTRGEDPMTVMDLARQAQVRLLAGGMQYVRPDLEED